MGKENKKYEDFLKAKVVIAESYGIDTSDIKYSDILFPHQRDIVEFCLQGGRRAIFADFSLGKTVMQLEIADQLILKTGRPFLIVCPLGVSGEFKRDNANLEHNKYPITYITDTDDFKNANIQIYLTNYERVRKGDINPEEFCGVSFDEASILRNLQTETTTYVLNYFKKIPYRFVATATPTPNDYIEILNYADFLGVISRGHALTRFFQRDPLHAGNLKLYKHKEEEFWQWVSTWAAFLNKPSDLGYDDTGYILPKLNVIEHRISYKASEQPVDKFGVPILFKDLSKSLLAVCREKRDSLPARINKAEEIARDIKGNVIIWHHLEDERRLLERYFKDEGGISVFGSQKNSDKENYLIEFSEGKYKYLFSKPRIAGQGCNFQYHCHDMIFAGIDYKFNDFIQSIHRCYRFRQKKTVNVHIIYTENEDAVIKVLKRKWQQHIDLRKKMSELIKNYGLNSNLMRAQMQRKMFEGGKMFTDENVTLYNNDCVVAMDDIPENSIGMVLTSIPFGDHYEYTDCFNDFGHNHGDENFFKQMDFLTPKLLKALEPGRIAAIHVKDRVRYSYQNGTKFTTLDDFSGQTVAHFIKHGFFLMGKITVTTDVVAENNQTYRLGWTEQCKDATKMGVGLPEYVLIFRKAPTERLNAYADNPIVKDKKEYTKAKWQLDAHAYYRINGDRILSTSELSHYSLQHICAAWKYKNETEIYSFLEHLRICEELDEQEMLSSTFMTLPVHSNNPEVWTDVNRMNTLNTRQANAKKEKHICPLQFDIIERLIIRYSQKGEIVLDPFGGLMSVPYKALELGRKSIGIELNSEYFQDGLFYVKAMLHKLSVPTLFDFEKEIVTESK